MEELYSFLVSLTKKKDNNSELFYKYINNFNYVDKFNNNLMHLMLDIDCNIKQKLLAIPTLVANGTDINFKNFFGDNFIQAAIRKKYSVDDIVRLLDVACECGFDVNGANSLKQNLLFTFIRSDRDFDDITTLLFSLIHNNNFDFKAKDDVGNTVLTYIIARDDIEDIFKKLLVDIIYDEIIDRTKQKQIDEFRKEHGNTENIISIEKKKKKRK